MLISLPVRRSLQTDPKSSLEIHILNIISVIKFVTINSDQSFYKFLTVIYVTKQVK